MPNSAVLLTGATGFLGGHLLTVLAERGIKASALVRDPDAGTPLPGNPTVVKGSPLAPPAATAPGVAGVKTIIHTAAVVKHSQRVPDDLFALNVDGTLNMVKLAKELGARMIFVSSSGTVGCFKHDDIAADEDAPYAEALAVLPIEDQSRA